MDDREMLALRFEQDRGRLRAVAYRMLGSQSDADDALQESWLRLHRADASGIDNISGWLTTVVGRVCLDMLRSRTSRREESLEAQPADSVAGGGSAAAVAGHDPEQEAVLADSVGLALLVVLDTLAPAERLSFVLHDMFAVPFEEIAPIVGRTPATARQLASRARRRVQGGGPEADEVAASTPADLLARQREVVNAFLAASRGGDFAALLALLDPDVVFRADATAAKMGSAALMRGSAEVAGAFVGRAEGAQPALVDGRLGAAVYGPTGRLLLVLAFTVDAGRVAAIDVTADRDRLAGVDLELLAG